MKTGHLTPSQTSFFKKWESLITLEEQDLLRFRKELWTMGAKERETKGRCFGAMILDPAYRASASLVKGEGKIHQFTYRFVRQKRTGSGDTASLLSGHMAIGDAVTVSVEPDLLALARGFILELEPERVVLGVDHEVGADVVKTRMIGRGGADNAKLVFRIDKDELFGGMGRVRDNLAKVFYAGGDTKRLELVVDLRPPEFRPIDIQLPPSVPNTLNANQRRAVDKVLSAQDFALILGMPGTGKTTVIAAIIRTLVSMGKSVLLTSYTHSAVDNILGKLGGEEEKNILRLGNIDKV
jgi:DNA replication ATP-dependent helicase Dna2